MPRHKQTELPKWEQKLNWLLRELARIWYGKTDPYLFLEDEGFVKAFRNILFQFYLDCYGSKENVWDDIKLLFSSKVPDTFYLTQANLANALLIRISLSAILVYELEPPPDKKTIRDVLRIAHEIELRLQRDQKPPYHPVKGIRALSYYENLPVLPID
jgi:hypothetical protein